MVITETRPFLHDGIILPLCREHLGGDPRNYELISLGSLKHFLKEPGSRIALRAYALDRAARGQDGGVLVIAAGGSHKAAVRLLREKNGGVHVTGVTLADRGERRASTVLIVWSEPSLHGTGALRDSAIEQCRIRRSMHLLSLPVPAQAMLGNRIWYDALINGLRHLHAHGTTRAILVGDVLRFNRGIDGYASVTDLTTVRKRIEEAVPAVSVEIAGITGGDTGAVSVVPLERHERLSSVI